MGAAMKAGVVVVAAAFFAGHLHGHSSPGDPRGWQAALLREAHEPVTACNVSFLSAWRHAENTDAAYNPLATTMPEPGSTTFNSSGVRNYTSPRQGVRAMAATIRNGRYPELVADLRAGDDAQACADDVAESPWGTEPFNASC
jgi:hypothetical protein